MNLRNMMLATCVVVLAGLSTVFCVAAEETVTIEFLISVPDSTPANATVYIAGSLQPVGSWRADGKALAKQSDGRWHSEFRLPKGGELEYKFTLGTWSGVEKGKSGEEIGNRVLRLESNKKIEAIVQSWAKPQSGGAETRARREPTLTGLFRHHEAFESQHLTAKRDILVYLPPGYGNPANSTRRYPVLYMHDGQNLFDAATSFGGVEWRLDETAEKLIEQGKIVPIIIVGIYNTPNRMTEYTYGSQPRPKGRNGEDYLQFLVEELKPFIDKTYRTKPDRKSTAVGGSSLGGLISLYIASTRPDVFSMAAVISPSLFWDNARAIREVQKHVPYPKDTKFWLDIGTREGRLVEEKGVGSAVIHCRELVAEFDKAGLVKETNYHYYEVEGASHNEYYWSQRVDRMLIYLFGK